MLTAVSQRGASPLSAMANITRAVTYTPEFRHDSTAVMTMRFMAATETTRFPAAREPTACLAREAMTS